MSHHDAHPEHIHNVHGIATKQGDPALFVDHEGKTNAARLETVDTSHPDHPAKLHVQRHSGGHHIVEGAAFDPSGKKPNSWHHHPPLLLQVKPE